MKPETIRHHPIACPKCGKVFNAATICRGDGGAPRVGDLSLCFYCLEALIFIEFEERLALAGIKIDEIDDAEARAILTKMRELVIEKRGFAE